MVATRSTCRYAVYLMPSGPWSSLGQRWLGRDAGTGERIDRLSIENDAAIEAWTQAPRVYGLHATLKPPFRLARGYTFSDLDEGLRTLASSLSPFEIPLQLMRLRGFLAWCVSSASGGDTLATPDPLTRLANACVGDLDRFRAPPSIEETARRLRAELSPAQAENLRRWGYPYVFDTFIFHITLTGHLDEMSIAAAESALRVMARVDGALALAPGGAMAVNDIGLFIQAAPDLPFEIVRRYGFDGSVRAGRP